MADTSVKAFFGSQSAILPPLSGVAGSLATILRTCLVSGAGAINVQSLTVVDGVATASFATAHHFLVGSVVAVAGATPGGLNGEARVATVPSANAITFPTTEPNGTATGAITCKLAAAGWEDLFSATDKPVLRSLHEDATGMVLRVNDTGTTSARVVGYESMSDADTGLGPFPTAAQQAGGLYWPKADNSTGTRAWALWADARSFLLYTQPTAGSTVGSIMGFGDLAGDLVGLWDAFLAGHTTLVLDGGAGCLSDNAAAVSAALALPRAASGVGAAVRARLMSALRSSGVSGHATGSLLPAYPNPARGELLAVPAWVIAEDGYRGHIPGLLHLPQAPGWIGAFDVEAVPGLIPLPTRVGAVSGLAMGNAMEAWR